MDALTLHVNRLNELKNNTALLTSAIQQKTQTVNNRLVYINLDNMNIDVCDNNSSFIGDHFMIQENMSLDKVLQELDLVINLYSKCLK